jgi:hypothetical protein
MSELEWSSVAVREGHSLSAETRKRLAKREQRYTGRWVNVLERRFPDLPPAQHVAIAYSLLGLLNSVVNWPRAALALDGSVELLIGLALDGLASLAQDAAIIIGE